jgi:hypothetical protein
MRRLGRLLSIAGAGHLAKAWRACSTSNDDFADLTNPEVLATLANGSPLASTPRAANAAASRLGLRAPSPAVGPDSDSADSPMEYFSCDGCRQGDPHGPWLFALGIHATLLKVQEAYPGCHVFCYLDDAYIVGPPERAYEALKMLQRLARSECTLDTNLTKVDFYCPHALHDVVPAGQTPTNLDFLDDNVRGSPSHKGGLIRGFKCLGAFIGQPDWTTAALAKKLAAHLQPLDTLLQLRDTDRHRVALQVQLLMLRWCVNSVPNYWARTMPPSVVEPAVRTAHRSRVDGALERLLHFDGATPRGRRAPARSAAACC